MNPEIIDRNEKIRNGIVPEGYKKTNIGIFPEEWDMKKVKNFGKVVTGNTPKTSDKENYGNHYLFVTPADLGASKYILNTDRKLSVKGFSISRKYPTGSVLFTCIGSTIGKMGIAAIELTSNQQINAIICNPENNNEFLYYELKRLSKKIRLLAGEQAVPIINKTQFETTKIISPPLLEQSRIASILSTWDKVIGLKEKLIEQKKLQKKGLMQMLLTGKKRVINPETGKPFEGEWQEVRLGEVGTCIRGVTYKPSRDLFQNETNKTIRLLRANNIHNSNINFDDIQYVNKNNVTNSQILKENDIAICMSSGSKALVGKSAIFKKISKICTIGAFCSIFRIFENSKSNFIKQLFFSNHYSKNLKSLYCGTNINNLKGSDILNMRFIIPTNSIEQFKIASVLSTEDKEIELLEKELEKLKEQKCGFMQLLLTGIVRIKKIDGDTK